MRLLLDTQIALWALTDSERLGAVARGLIGDPENEIFVSTASVWEIAIKHGLGRGDMPVSGARAAELFNQIEMRHWAERHAAALAEHGRIILSGGPAGQEFERI